MMHMQTLWFLLLFLPVLQGYPNGPPISACNSMVPGHGGSPQSLASPFSIVLTTTTYRLGQNVSVGIATNDPVNSPFKGFLLQARIAGTSTPTGRFYPANGDNQVTLMSCSGGNSNTVSHNSPVSKAMKLFTWVAETDDSVYFQATFVKQKLTYWTNIQSETITEEVSTTATTTIATTPTATTPTATTPTTTSTTITTPTTPDTNSGGNPNNNPTTPAPTTPAPTTRGQNPSANDGATTPSSSSSTSSSVWSVLGLVFLWTLNMY